MKKRTLTKSVRRSRRKRSPLPKATRAFLRSVGLFVEHWGFKRIQGEIWATVYLSERPVTASAVAVQLGVSKSLVSLAMGELLEYRVLLAVDDEDARTQKLVPNENFGDCIASVLRGRELRMIERAGQSLKAARSKSPGGRALLGLQARRAQNLEAFITGTQSLLAQLIESMEKAPSGTANSGAADP